MWMLLLSVQGLFMGSGKVKSMEKEQAITVLFSPEPKVVDELRLSLDALQLESGRNVTVSDVLVASGLCEKYSQSDMGALVGIWGKAVTLDTVVGVGDRVEMYRPLQVDPKEARRLRYQKQGPVHSRHRRGYKGP